MYPDERLLFLDEDALKPTTVEYDPNSLTLMFGAIQNGDQKFRLVDKEGKEVIINGDVFFGKAKIKQETKEERNARLHGFE